MNIVNRFLLVFCFISIPFYAQNDVEGSKDHQLIPRFPGSTIIYFNKIENGTYNFTLGPLVKPSSDEDYRLSDTRILEGMITRIQYRINETEISKVVNYYEHSLKAIGFEIMAITKAVKPMEVAGRNWTLFVFKDLAQKEKSYIAGTKTGNDNRYYIAGHLHRLNIKAYFTIVINEFDTEEIYVQVDVIGSETNPERRVVLNAELIEQNINEDGFVQINGIYFESNSAELHKESEPAIKEVAKYLKSNMGVTLYVVGHTGMQGNLNYQLSLSKNMADALVKELANNYNINPERLFAEGVGPLSPITTNQNIEGRNINRRIVLVLKSF